MRILLESEERFEKIGFILLPKQEGVLISLYQTVGHYYYGQRKKSSKSDYS